MFCGRQFAIGAYAHLADLFGAFSREKSLDRLAIDWSTSAAYRFFVERGNAGFSFVWMNEPDLSQHQTGPVPTQPGRNAECRTKTWQEYCALSK